MTGSKSHLHLQRAKASRQLRNVSIPSFTKRGHQQHRRSHPCRHSLQSHQYRPPHQQCAPLCALCCGYIKPQRSLHISPHCESKPGVSAAALTRAKLERDLLQVARYRRRYVLRCARRVQRFALALPELIQRLSITAVCTAVLAAIEKIALAGVLLCQFWLAAQVQRQAVVEQSGLCASGEAVPLEQRQKEGMLEVGTAHYQAPVQEGIAFNWAVSIFLISGFLLRILRADRKRAKQEDELRSTAVRLWHVESAMEKHASAFQNISKRLEKLQLRQRILSQDYRKPLAEAQRTSGVQVEVLANVTKQQEKLEKDVLEQQQLMQAMQMVSARQFEVTMQAIAQVRNSR